MATRYSELGQSVDSTIARQINSKYDNVKIVADDIDSVINVSDSIVSGKFDGVLAIVPQINTVAGIADKVVTVADLETPMDTVISMGANITTVANGKVNIDKVAGIFMDVTKVVDMEAEITKAALLSQDVLNNIDENLTDTMEILTRLEDNATIINAMANIGWGTLEVVDGELISEYYNPSTSIPSLNSDGELVIQIF